jgi:hypothetical protein
MWKRVAAALAWLVGCGPAPAPATPEVTEVAIGRAQPLPAVATAPPEEAPAAAPGSIVGMGDVRVGQPIAEVRRILGHETQVVHRDEEAQIFRDAGYDPDKSLVFLLGFDTLHVYDTPPPRATLPFWKIYARDNKVVFIVLSSFTSGDMKVERVGFPPSCFMLAGAATIARTFGQGYLRVNDAEHGHETYHYLDRGISIIVVGGQVRVFNIYGPIDNLRRARVRQALGG